MMRNTVLVILLLSLAPTEVPAQSWAEKLFKEGVSHDHGSVPRGAQLYHKFKMTNIYAVPLEIINIRTSCTCVTVTPSTRTLEPRQEGFLEVLIDTRRFTGPKTFSIFVTVGPQYTSTAELKVSANSRGDVVFNPGEVNFGVVPRGQTPSQTIEVEYAGALDWRVSEVIKSTAPLETTLEEMYRRPGQVGYRVKVTLKPDAPPGSHKWELFLKTNDPASPLVPVLVEATIQAPLTVQPDPLKLLGVRVGAEAAGRVVVRSSGKPFRVLAIEGLGDGLTTTAPLPSREAVVHTIPLRCQPSRPGELRRVLQIKTDLQESPVPVTVEINAVP
ncbi:MAG TPA: DUF1573 domain-containing protein [Gemmataceae bacterium]|nr:DUF1573 domain-containing protein [Gemmataceae bacterium]